MPKYRYRSLHRERFRGYRQEGQDSVGHQESKGTNDVEDLYIYSAEELLLLNTSVLPNRLASIYEQDS